MVVSIAQIGFLTASQLADQVTDVLAALELLNDGHVNYAALCFGTSVLNNVLQSMMAYSFLGLHLRLREADDMGRAEIVLRTVLAIVGLKPGVDAWDISRNPSRSKKLLLTLSSSMTRAVTLVVETVPPLLYRVTSYGDDSDQAKTP